MFDPTSGYFAQMVGELHLRTNELRWLPASYTTEIDVHIGYLQKTVFFCVASQIRPREQTRCAMPQLTI